MMARTDACLHECRRVRYCPEPIRKLLIPWAVMSKFSETETARQKSGDMPRFPGNAR
jgi:hypothetical protein